MGTGSCSKTKIKEKRSTDRLSLQPAYLPDQQKSNTPAHLFHRRHITYLFKYSQLLFASIIEVAFPASSLQPGPKLKRQPHILLCLGSFNEFATRRNQQGGPRLSTSHTRARPHSRPSIHILSQTRAFCCLSIQQSHHIASHIILIAKIRSHVVHSKYLPHKPPIRPKTIAPVQVADQTLVAQQYHPGRRLRIILSRHAQINYINMHFFTSPTSNILSTSYTSCAMSRSDSRDSATSTSSTAWDIRPVSSSSASEHLHIAFPIHHRTFSSSSASSLPWTPPPYRSCLAATTTAAGEPSSYLSDDDLLYLSDVHDEEILEAPVQKELSTEEQIEMLRQYRQREEAQFQLQQQQQKKRARVVRFAGDCHTTVQSQSAKVKGNRKPRRPSALRRTSDLP